MISQIDGCKVISSPPFSDGRGEFFKLYSQSIFRQQGIDFSVVQVNLSVTYETGTVRGMHFQKPPYAEVKILRCVRGRVFDVVVDLRRQSDTFLHHQVFILDQDSHDVLVIPPGCAHGFQVLQGPAEIIYGHSEEYRPEVESGIHPLDTTVGIRWPLEPVGMSSRDLSFPLLGKDLSSIDFGNFE